MCRFYNNGVCTCKNDPHNKEYKCTEQRAAKCTLKQTEQEQAKSLQKAWRRFKALPLYKQTMYMQTYYYGRYPWQAKGCVNND